MFYCHDGEDSFGLHLTTASTYKTNNTQCVYIVLRILKYGALRHIVKKREILHMWTDMKHIVSIILTFSHIFRFLKLQPCGKNGYSPLHLAVDRNTTCVGRYPVCKFPSLTVASVLLECGADVNSRDDDDNRSVLGFPLHSGFSSLKLALLSLFWFDFTNNSLSMKQFKSFYCPFNIKAVQYNHKRHFLYAVILIFWTKQSRIDKGIRRRF